MKRTNIEFTDEIGGLTPSSDLVCAIGELKTMTAEYSCNTCIDRCVLTYNSAFALDGVFKPTINNNWQITIDNLTIGVEYPMTLQVDGSSQSIEYFQAKNFQVYFTQNTDTTFTIRHDFYIINDTNGYINQFGVNGYGNWLQSKSAYTLDNNANTLYNNNKFFTRYLELTGIDSNINENLLDFNLVTARFYENESNTPITSNWILNDPSEFYIDTPIQSSISFDSAILVPSSAKLMLINKSPDTITNDFDISIIEDSQSASITSVGTTYTIATSLTAKSVGAKDILAIVYDDLNTIVASIKLEGVNVLYGCYPTIEPRNGDYNTPYIGACIETTPFERVFYGYRVSRTIFNKVKPTSPICFADGFETYNKVARLKLTKQSDGTLLHESMAIYSGGVWTSLPSIGTGAVSVNTTASWYQFTYTMRNELALLGEYILSEFELDIYYSTTHIETIKCSSLNYVLNYDNALTSPIIESIKLIDPSTDSVISSMQGNIMTLNPSCLDYFKVRICKLDSSEYNIIPVLRQATNSFEYNSYTSTIMPQLTNSYFEDVPVDFGGVNCAEFYLDTSTLDKTLAYELVVIIKKV
jgi:hypothetical protein